MTRPDCIEAKELDPTLYPNLAEVVHHCHDHDLFDMDRDCVAKETRYGLIMLNDAWADMDTAVDLMKPTKEYSKIVLVTCILD